MIDSKINISELQKKKVLAPFFSSPLSFIPGQDPLGLLIISERTFRTLLPGLNNVTSRIRYYSFYCWFFDFYSREIGTPDKRTQFDYLRRGEYLFALLAAYHGWQGIPGINRATHLLDKDKPEQSLLEGTQEDSGVFEGSYWKNGRGVFGQNYVNSMVQIGLLREQDDNNGIYIRTSFDKEGRVSGRQIAEAFKESIGSAIERKLIDAINSGSVSTQLLEEFGEPLDMKRIVFGSTEQKLLWQLLTGPDEPKQEYSNSFRKQTFRFLLETAKDNEFELGQLPFVLHAYEDKGIWNGQRDEAWTLWYYFQLDQFWHIVATGSLSAFLNQLKAEHSGAWCNEDKFIQNLSKEVSDRMASQYGLNETSSFENVPIEGLSEDELVRKMLRNDVDSIDTIVAGILLLRKLHAENSVYYDLLEGLSVKHQVQAPGNYLNSIKLLLELKKEPLEKFVGQFVLQFVILRHQWVAYRKMTVGQSTEKLIREDGLIRFVDAIEYGYSDARLITAINFLRDLELVDKEDSLSADGEQLLDDMRA